MIMKRSLLYFSLIPFLVATLAGCSKQESTSTNPPPETSAKAETSKGTETNAEKSAEDWREEYAYTLGQQAYIYAFPLLYMSKLRYDWTNVPDSSFYASLNHFHHKKVLSNHENYTSGGSPNQDTLYSWGWMDLRNGPVILSHPEMGNRYFTFEIADYFSDNFAYVGKRTTGGQAGAYAIVPPGWKGTLPADIKDKFESPTNFVLIFGRTLVSDEADVPVVNKLQDQYKMTPLSLWGKPNAKVPEGRDVFKPYDSKDDPLAAWRTINRAWAENPLPADRDRDLVKLFKEIGIGPEFSAESLDKLPEATRRGLARAAAETRPMIDQIMATGAYRSKIVNGWNYPPVTFGRAGLVGDFPTRAGMQSLAGIIANDPAEAVYLNRFTDNDGETLAGGRKYTVRFDGKNLPPVTEFYSLTMYQADSNFVPNELKRYSFGDRSKNVSKESDGSYTLYLQPDEPAEAAKKSNWLPSPKSGTFYLVLRTYGPKDAVIKQTWEPPAVDAVK